MRTDTHKEWTDAFRESFPEEVRPTEGGWEAVAGRMRRAAARRRAAIAAAALALPLAGGGLFLAFRQPTATPGLVAVAPAPVTSGNSSVSEPIDSTPLEVVDTYTGLLADAFTPKSKSSPVTEAAVSEPLPADVSGAASDIVPSAVPDTTPEVIPGSTATDVIPDNEKDTPPGTSLSEIPDLPDIFPFPDDPEPSRKSGRDRRLTVGISAGSTAGGAPSRDNIANIAGNLVTKSPDLAVSNSFWNNSSTMILQKKYVHDLPVSLGLNFRYGLTDRIFVESGIEYSYLHSRQDDIHSELHFAGIPLRMDFVILTAGPFELYAGAGGKVEKCLKASLGGIEVKERDLQWSASARIGSQLRLAENVRLYLEPDLSYYFTKTAITTYRTENPLGLTVRAGLRFDINH